MPVAKVTDYLLAEKFALAISVNRVHGINNSVRAIAFAVKDIIRRIMHKDGSLFICGKREVFYTKTIYHKCIFPLFSAKIYGIVGCTVNDNIRGIRPDHLIDAFFTGNIKDL